MHTHNHHNALLLHTTHANMNRCTTHKVNYHLATKVNYRCTHVGIDNRGGRRDWKHVHTYTADACHSHVTIKS